MFYQMKSNRKVTSAQLKWKKMEMLIILCSQELKCIIHLNRFIKCQKVQDPISQLQLGRHNCFNDAFLRQAYNPILVALMQVGKC